MSCSVVTNDAGICANCAVSSDKVKLKNCNACLLVKYCGVDCQKAHRKQHKKACKLRATQLKDERLYSQGLERHEGDFCPICTLAIVFPMSDHSRIKSCCMTRVCNGCAMAAQKRGMSDCPFCRAPYRSSEANALARVQARAEKKDPEAINSLGEHYHHGGLGLQKDVRRAIVLYTEAAELGSIRALYQLGVAHYDGDGVRKDEAKAIQLYEKAAIQGCAFSRHNLGCYEGKKWQYESHDMHWMKKGEYSHAYKHWLISAKMGYKESVDKVKLMVKLGFATNGQYAEALRGYQDAVEEMKSHDRDEAKRLLDST